MYDQADGAKNAEGRIWMVGQKGFEICVFIFDVLKYNEDKSPLYPHFIPFNLHRWTVEQFRERNIEV